MPAGYLALVLHAHLPFVRHPEYDDFLEEDWLYEAITETYIPILDVFDGLDRDGFDWRGTPVPPSPPATLCDPPPRHNRHPPPPAPPTPPPTPPPPRTPPP